MVQYLEPQTNVESATFQFNGHLFMLHKTCATTCVVFMVIKDDQEIDVQSIKDQCTSETFELIKELARRFPTHGLMNATRIIYPQYWEATNVKVTFVDTWQF